jgi:hypothetical protein
VGKAGTAILDAYVAVILAALVWGPLVDLHGYGSLGTTAEKATEPVNGPRAKPCTLDAEVLPLPVRRCILFPLPHGGHPAAGAICSHVFDRTVNKTRNGLEDLGKFPHHVLSSTYLNRTPPQPDKLHRFFEHACRVTDQALARPSPWAIVAEDGPCG